MDFPVSEIRTEILGFEREALDESLNIADAEAIVCVGNGIKARRAWGATGGSRSSWAASSPARGRSSTGGSCPSSWSSASLERW
mgnify:CR=1 FL=1